MAEEPDFKSELPSEDAIEEGRKSSMAIGLVIGGIIIAIGLISYLIFGKYLQF